ncbi:MAG TPA: hypothetical protein VH796_13270 [Nitrososphaeraceae archaeon]|jgi:hypothetical protein
MEVKNGEEWTLEKMCPKMHALLDSRWIKDEKEGNWKRKYRESEIEYVARVVLVEYLIVLIKHTLTLESEIS